MSVSELSLDIFPHADVLRAIRDYHIVMICSSVRVLRPELYALPGISSCFYGIAFGCTGKVPVSALAQGPPGSANCWDLFTYIIPSRTQLKG